MGPDVDARADRVRARIADALLRPVAGGERVGRFVLRTAQRESVTKLHAALREFGGALLADSPGTGKTVVALAVAAACADVLVVLPATLRAQWTRAAARAGVAIRIATFEALSRSARPEPAGLVVVDEAHHTRTPGTVRYRVLAHACAGAQVLLLTATPVVNRRADRDALLALFLGGRAGSLSPAELARVIVRRTPERGLRPRVRRLPPLGAAAEVPGLAKALRGLPDGLAASDGSLAPSLVRISLALAWCSSLAALDAALRRRLLRGGALRDALLEGRWPSRRALRSWVMSDEGSQLTLPGLVVPVSGASFDSATALARVNHHLEAVRAMRTLIAPHVGRDSAARARAIEALLCDQPGERVVVFARHADTIRALWRELRLIGGVVAITGTRVDAAAGRWRREEVLDAVGARSGPLGGDDARAVRLVLATDLLAEGVEMPGVKTVVHADLAWTPARLEQRVGRITRAGSGVSDVREVRFALPRAATPFVRLAERLRRKQSVRHDALADTRARDALERLLERWSAAASTDRSAAAVSAAVHASRFGFIALVHGPLVLAGRRVDGRWRLSSSPRAVLRLARGASGPEVPLPPRAEQRIRAMIGAELEARAARALAAFPAQADSPDAQAPRRAALLADRISARFARLLRRAAFVERPVLARLQESARGLLSGGIGVAVERDLRRAVAAHTPDEAFTEAVRAAIESEGRVGRRGRPPHEAGSRAGQLAALLVLTPRARPHEEAPHFAPPSTSP